MFVATYRSYLQRTRRLSLPTRPVDLQFHITLGSTLSLCKEFLLVTYTYNNPFCYFIGIEYVSSIVYWGFALQSLVHFSP
jgi:hypothetical protein